MSGNLGFGPEDSRFWNCEITSCTPSTPCTFHQARIRNHAANAASNNDDELYRRARNKLLVTLFAFWPWGFSAYSLRKQMRRGQRGWGFTTAAISLAWSGVALIVLVIGILAMLIGCMSSSTSNASPPPTSPSQSQPATAPSTPSSSPATQPSNTGLVAYQPTAGSCEYRVGNGFTESLWVKATNPDICKLMAQHAVYSYGNGYISFLSLQPNSTTPQVPSTSDEQVLYTTDSYDANGNTIPNSVEVVTMAGSSGGVSDTQVTSDAQLVSDTLTSGSAMVPSHTATSFTDSGSNGNPTGSFFEVGPVNGPNNLAAGTWHSNGNSGGSVCSYTVYSSARDFDAAAAGGSEASTAEIADGNNTNQNTGDNNAPMSMTLKPGNLVNVTGGCSWSFVGTN